jgi:zinc finger CCHC domain-containing protein 9
MTKEERRKKYTDIARKRRQKLNGNHRRGGDSGRKNLVCYNCRLPGHTASECPSLQNDQEAVCTPASVLCYKCGSTEHALHNCPKRHRGDRSDLPFATCFICNEKGHLASACSQNKTGIYVNGGSCRVCGSQQHLASNCPEKKKNKKKDKDEIEEEKFDDLLKVEEDSSSTTSRTRQESREEKQKAASEEQPKKKKKRVVNF